MNKLKKTYEELGPVKFFFFLFLLLNACVILYGCMDLLVPYFKDGVVRENFLFNNLHLSADRNDTFMDFFNIIQYGRTPYTRKVIYPPLINVVYSLFGALVPQKLMAQGTVAIRDSVQGLMVFALFCVLTAIVSVVALAGAKGLTRKEKWFLGVGLCFTIPAVFCIERGNSVWLCVAFTMIFVNWYDSETPAKKWAAIFSLAIAASIKIYPAAFGLLLIRHKKWKETIEAIIVGALVMFVPFVYFTKDNRSILLWITNIINCNNEFQDVGVGFKVNFSNIMQSLSAMVQVDFTVLGKILVVLIVLVDCALVVLNPRMEEWKAVALLSLLMVLVPGFSWTYTMMFMFVPLIVFLADAKEELWNGVYLLLFVAMNAVIMVDNQFDSFAAINMDMKYRLGWTTVVEGVALLALQICIVVECFQKSKFKSNKNASAEKDSTYIPARNGNVEVLRFLFCMGIVLYHAWVDRRGYIGVEFFFMITGFLMAKKVDKQRREGTEMPGAELLLKNSWKEVLHRYRSVFPYFMVASVLGTIVNCYAFQWDVQRKIFFNLRLLPYDFLLLQNFGFPTLSATGVVWYLSAMMFGVWLLYPIMRRFYKAFMYAAPVISIVLTGIIIENCGTLDAASRLLFGWVNTGFLRAISAITLGAFVYFLADKLQKIPFGKNAAMMVTVLELLGYACVAEYIFIWKEETVCYDGIIYFIIAASFLLTTSQKSLLYGKFDNRACMFLGKITVPIFFSHLYCVQRMSDILTRMNIQLPKVQVTLISFGVAAIAAAIVYLVGNWVDRKMKQATEQIKQLHNMRVEESI